VVSACNIFQAIGGGNGGCGGRGGESGGSDWAVEVAAAAAAEGMLRSYVVTPAPEWFR
jgi:hypothetical protein